MTRFNDPALGNNHQPSWTQNLHRDVVGNTKNVVNWGLMTYADVSPDSGAAACVTTNYDLKVAVNSLDIGDVTAIEGYMRLRYFNSLPNPGLGVDGGTPTKGAIDEANAALTATWNLDPKQACNRAYGVILCTDGESNTCNTGSSGAGNTWGGASCTADSGGTDFVNYPPGAAEAMYLNAHQRTVGSTDAIIRARTFAIGISPDVSRCELNRTAYRGRTDANAKKRDAGFLLWDSDPSVPLVLQGDRRLPHLDFPQTVTSTNDFAFSLMSAGSGRNRISRVVLSTV